MRMPSLPMISATLALLLQYAGGGSSGITVESGGTANTVPKFSAGPVLVDSLFTDDGSVGGYSGASGFQSDFFIPTAANPASTGVFRLNNNTKSCWRNAANSADLCIWYDGSDVFNIDGSSSGTIWDLTNVAEPATPASGVTSVYVDSTSKTLSAINDAGTVSNTVVAKTCAAGDYISAVSAAGVATCGTPAGGVDTSGTPVDNDIAQFTDADTIEGRSYAEHLGDLGLEVTTVDQFGFASPVGNPWIGQNASWTNPGANNVQVAMWWLPYRLTVADFNINVVTPQAASNCGVGVYNASGTLMVRTAAIDTSTGGAKSAVANGGSVTLEPGAYYGAATCDNASVILTAHQEYGGTLTVVNADYAVGGRCANTSTSAVLPATCGAVSSQSENWAFFWMHP